MRVKSNLPNNFVRHPTSASLPLLGHEFVLFCAHDSTAWQECEISAQKLCKKEEERRTRKLKHHHNTSWRDVMACFHRLTKLCLLNLPSSEGISIPSIKCRKSFQSSKAVPSKMLDSWVPPSASPSMKASAMGPINEDGGLSPLCKGGRCHMRGTQRGGRKNPIQIRHAQSIKSRTLDGILS